MAQPTGFVIYRGASLLDNAPIVVVAVVSSKNEKTGNMVQTYILRDDINPIEATKTGDDVSICGDCKHRPILGGACYVRVFQGPNVVWKSYKANKYPDASPAHVSKVIRGRMVRLGSYGDPMAVPASVWVDLVSRASGSTGYTHQWYNEGLSMAQRHAITRLCMASVDNESEALKARDMDLRYFRVRSESEELTKGEFVCPASDEGGKRTNCNFCGACDGSDDRGSNKASPVIIVHGSMKARFEKQQRLIETLAA